MSNKKTLKRNKRNNKRGKSKKGGFFGLFKDNHNSECEPNNLNNLETSNELHSEYQKCCPKSWYGRKNNSQYCKDIDLNYKDTFNTRRKDANLSKQLMTQTFTTDDNGAVDMIDCEDPELYNDEESIAKYNAACNCDKTRWNPFSKKRKNCGIVKKKLEYIKNSEQDAQTSRQQEQQRREQEQQAEQERQYQIRQAKQKRSQEMRATEEEERKRKVLANQNYDNIAKKKREERDKFIDNYMKKYPVNLYSYTREQLARYPKEIIQNNRSKEEYVNQFMIKYNPKEYGYTYDELMMDTKRVMREVKEKEPDIEHKRYQENLDPYDIEKDAPLEKEDNKYVDILGEDDEGDYSPRSFYGGSKTRKYFKKRSIKKQKRRKTRKH
jgi:hypothetical protein